MRRNTFILAIVVLLVFALVIGKFYFSEASYSTTNPFWNGIGKFTSVYQTDNLFALSDLSGLGEGSTLLVVGPTVNYTSDDAAPILDYLERGGKVVIMDDYGSGNTLLEALDAPISLDQRPLCQDNDYYVRASFPLISNFTPDSQITANTIVLNHPVPLNLTESATIVATTSSFGWLDLDDDSTLGWTEHFDVYTVMASAQYGNGQLVVIGDPDIITNGMIERSGNKLLMSDLLKNSEVYIDMTHGHEVPPLARLYLLLKSDIATQLLCTIIIVLLGYTYYKREGFIRLLRKPQNDEEGQISRKESLINYLKLKFLIDEDEIRELNKKI